jgi:4-amino-4-deoxy-L-arabinose transferase-like glycosyltransferase
MAADDAVDILAPPRAVPIARAARAVAEVAAAAIALLVVLRLAVHATLPAWAIALAAPAATLGLVVAGYRALAAPFGLDRAERPLLCRHGFGVVALGTLLALPMLGAFTLVDPWESHYAEVAREMLERRDFVSPWWAHEGWFMSKPVLTFWLEALAMKAFGAATGPDAVLAGGARPEWAVRFPGFALALVGSYVLYNGVSRTCGRRAGFLGAVALWTMPGFALLSHQALTDMPLVACVAASLGLLLRALDTPEATRVPRFAIAVGSRTLVLHAGHALAALVFALAAPQLVMLVFDQLGGLRFAAGSPHACGLPGQPACAAMAYAHPRLPPVAIVALFVPAALFLAMRAAEETRAARLFALGAWAFAALAAMAKGPAGLVVPAAAALAAVAARRSLRPLLRLEIPTGLLLAATLIAPWYLAVWARHGRVFLDELVFRHMLGRTLDHLHDTNDGDDVGIAYFVKQLGYATFPWSGVALAAALAAPAQEDRSRRGAARALLFGGAVVAFALVSAMRTKFHHYVLVAVPPCAMLAGTWLDERVAEAEGGRASTGRPPRARMATTAALALAAACVVALVARDLVPPGHARLVHLLTYRYDRRWPATHDLAPAFAAFGGAAALATLALGARTRAWRRGAALAIAAIATTFAAFVLDVYLARAASDGGQRGVLEAFYRARAAAPTSSPLVAYQLNWKGENFYTGNHIAIFVSSGAPMKTWLDARRQAGEHTFYFVTEHGRVAGLRAELGTSRSFEKLTDEHTSAEFALVRADL